MIMFGMLNAMNVNVTDWRLSLILNLIMEICAVQKAQAS